MDSSHGLHSLVGAGDKTGLAVTPTDNIHYFAINQLCLPKNLIRNQIFKYFLPNWRNEDRLKIDLKICTTLKLHLDARFVQS
jgi:hypothetical protein